jgi:hypothetical protein
MLACGTSGKGRLVDEEQIIQTIVETIDSLSK